MKLIIGLGNPDEKYENTRHNAGYMFVDFLASPSSSSSKGGDEEGGLGFSDSTSATGYTQTKIAGEQIILAKNTTSMNKSGQAVLSLVDRFDLNPADILVAHDDLDLPAGDFKLQFNRGSAGHKGVESVIKRLGGRKDFYRLRLGIDRPKGHTSTEDYVLTPFNSEELGALQGVFEVALRRLKDSDFLSA